MSDQHKTPNLFIREIPFLVLLIFWVFYTGIEIIRGSFDILTSVIPIGLFIIAYAIARWWAKGKKG